MSNYILSPEKVKYKSLKRIIFICSLDMGKNHTIGKIFLQPYKEGEMMTLGEKIKILRKKKYTQEELAERLGVHVNTIVRWERGDRNPTADKLKELADVLDTTSDYLLDDTDDSFVGDEQEGITKERKTPMPRMRKEHSLEENRGMVVYKANGQEIEIPATRDFYKLFELIIDGMKSGVPRDETLSMIEQGQDGSMREKRLSMA